MSRSQPPQAEPKVPLSSPSSGRPTHKEITAPAVIISRGGGVFYAGLLLYWFVPIVVVELHSGLDYALVHTVGDLVDQDVYGSVGLGGLVGDTTQQLVL